MALKTGAIGAIGTIASIVLIGGFVSRERRPPIEYRPILPGRWDPKSAADYLDQRQSWWEAWPKSARIRACAAGAQRHSARARGPLA